MSQYDFWIQESWRQWMPDEYGWHWGVAQLTAESSLNPNARSPVGALGLAQFMPDTWGDVKEALNFPTLASPLDPQYAIQGFCWYLRTLWDKFTAPHTPLDKIHLAQAAYNCGIGNVVLAQKKAGANDYISISQFLPSETSRYVQAIGSIYLQLPGSILTEANG